MSDETKAVTKTGDEEMEPKQLRERTKSLVSTLEGRREEFERALVGRVDPGLFIQMVAQAFLGDPKLQRCSFLSLYVGAMEAATLGLRIDGEEGTLIPYRDKDTGTVDAQFQPGYQGYVRLMLRAGAKKVESRIVKSGDDFSYGYGLEPWLRHTPAFSEDQGETTHAYGIVWLPDGEKQFEVMDLAELEKVRKTSKAPNSPAWRSWTDQMYRKAPLRRLRKFVELSPEASAAFRKDSLLDAGRAVPIGTLAQEFETRSLEERAQAAVTGQVERMSAALEANGEEESTDPLDRVVEFGRYKGKAWRDVLGSSRGYGYVKHYVLTDADDDSLTKRLRDALEAVVAEGPPGDDPEDVEALKEEIDSIVEKLGEYDEVLEPDQRETIDLLHHDGNVDGLIGIRAELEERLDSYEPGDLFEDDE